MIEKKFWKNRLGGEANSRLGEVKKQGCEAKVPSYLIC